MTTEPKSDKLRGRAQQAREELKAKIAAQKKKNIERNLEERTSDPDKFKHKPKKQLEYMPHNFEWIKVEWEILFGPFSKSEIFVYGYIRGWKRGLYQTNETIGNALNLSKGTVQGAVKKLLEYGVITSEPYPDEDMRQKLYHMGKKPPASGRTLKIVPRGQWAVLKLLKKNPKIVEDEAQAANLEEYLHNIP